MFGHYYLTASLSWRHTTLILAGWFMIGATPALANPEKELTAIVDALAAADLHSAEKQARELTTRYPHFQLGHLILGDVLQLSSTPETLLPRDKPSLALTEAEQVKLNELRAEALIRLRYLTERLPTQQVPAIRLAPNLRLLFVADTSRGRLWVYQKRGTTWHLSADLYTSQGRAGDNKVREGDLKTPLGIYRVTGELTRLPDLYGVGALPLNYPSQWDLYKGRTGSDIWLHGVPRAQYSRAPLASEGCLTVSNDNMTQLLGWYRRSSAKKKPAAHSAPLFIIRNGSPFNDSAAIKAQHQRFEKHFDYWRKTQQVQNISILPYPNEPDTYWVQFERQIKGKRQTVQQYWQLQQDKWKLTLETT